MANLLFLTTSYPSSPDEGVCGFIDDLARALVERHEHSVRVLTPSGDFRGFEPVDVRPVQHAWPATRRLTADADHGMAIRNGWARKAEAVSLTASFARAARRSLDWADIVVTHWLVPSALAAGLSGARPHIAVAHGGDVHLLGRMRGGLRIARFIAARADRIVCVSRDLEKRFVDLAPAARSKIRVVRMGANIGPEPDEDKVRAFREARSPNGSQVVLFLGRLQPIKGVDVLLESAASVPDVDIWIAGDGPEEARLLEQARAARLRVSFPGRVGRQERRVALAACDAVAIPSRIEPNGRMEGTPVVCAESFASGRPVIATRTGGLAESIDDGVTGLLVAPDDARALAEAMRRFAADRRLRESLSEGARRVAPRFDMSATAETFDEMIAAVREAGQR